jgi:hypothetical protein
VTKTVTGTGAAQAVTLNAGDVTTLTDGTVSVSAVATDAAGNASGAGATSFALDTVVPGAPVLALGTGVGNGATSAEATAAGGVVTVNGETGASIAVTFTNGAHTVTKTVTGTGAAQAVTLNAGDVTTLTDGTVSVSASQTDAAGNASGAGTTNFALDTLAPAVTPSSPADGGLTLGLASNLVLASSETLAKGVGTLSLFKSDNTLVEAINVASGQVTITGTGNATQVSINPTADLVNGQDYYVKASAGALVDTAGNAWAGINDTTTWNFTGAGATVNIGTVAGDNTVNLVESGVAIPVAGTLTAEAGVLAAFTVGNMTAVLHPASGSDIALTGLSYTGATGNWSATIAASALAGTADYTLTVRFDGTTGLAAGITGIGTSNVHVDTVSPSAPVLALGTGVGNGATSAEATAAGGVVTVNGETGASIAVTFTNGVHTVTKTVTGTGAAQAVTLNAGDVTTLTDGTISVSALQTDAAGNPQTASAATTSFALDTAVPGAPVLALGAGVGNGATSAEATAAGGVVTVNGETGASIAVTFTNGVHTVTKTVTGTGAAQAVTLNAGDVTTLTDGTVSVSAVATDAAGNASGAGTTSFALDTAVPGAPVLALGTGVGNGATSAEATAAGGVVTVNGETGASIAVTFTNGVHTVTKTVTGTGAAQAVTLNAGDVTTLTDGTVSVSASQTDAAGNASGAGTTSFVLDATAPTLAISDDGGNAGTGVFTYNFTFSEAVTGFDATDVTVANGAKGTFSSTNASHYNLLVTPTSSVTPQSMTVNVAGSAATDTAGNGNAAAAQVLHSVLYGTSGADTLTVGALADTVFLGAGNDVLRVTHATDSTVATPDKVFDFAAGDKLDLAGMLGAGGAGYTSSLQADTGLGFMELKNVTLTKDLVNSRTVINFDVHLDAITIGNSKISGVNIDLIYNYGSVLASSITIPTFSYDDGLNSGTAPYWSPLGSNLVGASATGLISAAANLSIDNPALTNLFVSTNPIITPAGNALSVRLTVSGLVDTFSVGLESRAAGGQTSIVTFDNVDHPIDVGVTKVAGASIGTTGVLEIVTDTGALGAVGDNTLHMLATYDAPNNLTHLQLSYDTNPTFGAGQTTASSIIAMDFVGDVTANLIPANLTYI